MIRLETSWQATQLKETARLSATGQLEPSRHVEYIEGHHAASKICSSIAVVENSGPIIHVTIVVAAKYNRHFDPCADHETSARNTDTMVEERPRASFHRSCSGVKRWRGKNIRE